MGELEPPRTIKYEGGEKRGSRRIDGSTQTLTLHLEIAIPTNLFSHYFVSFKHV